jgi:hypothetical protein
MSETYRMLGKEREQDLLREAQRLHAGASARKRKRLSWSLRGFLGRSDDQVTAGTGPVRADEGA